MKQIKLNPKRIFAWALTLALVFTMLPIMALTASAEDGESRTLYYNPTDSKLYSTYSDLNYSNEVTDLLGWSGNGATLTLNNFNFITTANTALKVPTGTTITLADGTTNSITSTATSSGGAALSSGGTVTITGNTGTLALSAGNTPYGSWGISTQGLIISGGTVTATGGAATSFCSEGAYIAGDISVTGGTLNAIGSMAATKWSIGIEATGTISVTGTGRITARGNDNAIKGCSDAPYATAQGTVSGETSSLQDATWDSSGKTYKIGDGVAKYIELTAGIVSEDSDAAAVKAALLTFGAADGDVTISGKAVTFSGGTATMSGSDTLTIPTGITLEIGGGTLNLETTGNIGIENLGTLNVKSGTLKIANSGNYGISNKGTLDVTGGTVNIQNTSNGVGIYNYPYPPNETAIINISGGTVNIENSSGNSGITNFSLDGSSRGLINISDNANIIISNTSGGGIINCGDMEISGGSITIQNATAYTYGISNSSNSSAEHLSGKITMTNGTLTVANTDGTGILNSCNTNYATLEITGGTIQGGGTIGNIELEDGSMVTAPDGKFNDRDTAVNASGGITVGAADDAASTDRLSAGTYRWDNISSFKKATAVTVTSVTVKNPPTKTTYTAGESLDLSGLVVTLNKSDSTTEDVAFADFTSGSITVNPTNGTTLTTSNTKVTITYITDSKSVEQAITVNTAVVAPVITTEALPNGTVGSDYSHTLTAAGDTPITWSISSGSLPAGLSLSGDTISGTPTMAETQVFTVKATNSAGSDIKSLSITINAAQDNVTHTITASAGTGGTISPSGAVSVAEGDNQTFTITPNSNYKISSVTVDGVNQGAITSYTFSNVTANHTITAAFSYKSSSGGGGGNYYTPTPAPTPAPAPAPELTPTNDIKVEANGSASYTANVENSTLTAEVPAASINDSVEKLLEDLKTNPEKSQIIEIKVSGVTDEVNAAEFSLSSTAVVNIVEKTDATLFIDTGNIGTLEFDNKALTAIVNAGKGDLRIKTEDITNVTNDKLTNAQKAAIGNNPVYDFGVFIGNTRVSEFGLGTVTINLPYTPKAGENTNNIIIYYVDENGKIHPVENSRYDSKTGTVVFTTNHFSLYMIGKQFTVTYKANGGGTVSEILSDETKYGSGNIVTVKGIPISTSKFFAGWNTKADGTGKSYTAGKAFVITGDTTLYAQWKDVITGPSKLQYKVTGKNEVACIGTTNKDATTITIGKSVTYRGITYKISSIAKSAFRGNEKITTVKIGSNVKTINDAAFYKCTNLKKVTIGTGLETLGKHVFCYVKADCVIIINSTKLKTVKTAINHGAKKMTLRVPKSKLNAYKKLFAEKSKHLTVKAK